MFKTTTKDESIRLGIACDDCYPPKTFHPRGGPAVWSSSEAVRKRAFSAGWSVTRPRLGFDTPEQHACPECSDQRIGAEILASDRTPRAVAEVFRATQWHPGRPDAFPRMDARDNRPDVPEWHAYLRRARNNCKDFFAILRG